MKMLNYRIVYSCNKRPFKNKGNKNKYLEYLCRFLKKKEENMFKNLVVWNCQIDQTKNMDNLVDHKFY
jgi:hypothetical protein